MVSATGIDVGSIAAAAGDPEESKLALKLASDFLDHQPELFEASLFDLVPALLQCARTSEEAKQACSSIMDRVGTRCSSPRELIMIVLAQLDEAAREEPFAWTPAHSSLLACLPEALARLQRRRSAFLADCFSIALAIVRRAYEEGLNFEVDSCNTTLPPVSSLSLSEAAEPPSAPGPAHASVCAVTECLLRQLDLSVVNKMEEKEREEACAVIYGFAARALLLTAEVALQPDPSSCLLRCLSARASRALLDPLLQRQHRCLSPGARDSTLLVYRAMAATGSGDGPDACQGFVARAALHSLSSVKAAGGEEDEQEDTLLGWALCMHAHAALLPRPSYSADPKAWARRDVTLRDSADLVVLAATAIMNAAGARESEVLALKGMGLVAAVAAMTKEEQMLTGQLTKALRQLLHLLVTTMAANPLSTVRNAAYYALDAVLSACTMYARLTAIEAVLDEQQPGVSALAIQRLTRDADALWPGLPHQGLAVPLPAETAAAEFAILQPALLPLLHAWLNPKGSRGWHTDDGAIANAEALCAVLSLYRFLLLRESALGSNLTGVGVTNKAVLREMLERRIRPLHAAAQRSAQRLGLDDAIPSTSSNGKGDPASTSTVQQQHQGLMHAGSGGVQAYMAVARLEQAAAIIVQLLERGLAHVPDEELRRGAQRFLSAQA